VNPVLFPPRPFASQSRLRRLRKLVCVRRIGLRLDTDVIACFQAGGAGNHARMNAVLRRTMATQRKAG
jgi:uncharacterized protein (DUF4415 family)